MPYAIVSHRDGTYSVKNKTTGKVFSYRTTYQRALSQMRLLYALEEGFRPTQ